MVLPPQLEEYRPGLGRRLSAQLVLPRAMARETAMFLRLSDSIRHTCRAVVAAFAAAMVLLGASAHQARAQQPFVLPGILAPGDAVVTGFSGTMPPLIPLAPGMNPLDFTFINPEGNSMEIERLQPNGPPAGQLIPSPSMYAAIARDVGQAFAVTLDNATPPNIYIGATSIFGLNIVAPDPAGPMKRVKTGQPGARWMDGQWGTAKGGTAGSIYKIDGATGAVTLFTTIGANSGAGLGDVVYDRSSRQFYVSDLDNGRIYRLDATGLIIDSFDHGVAGRPLKGLPPVADDGSAVDISNPAFNTENPATWGYTQKQRMVWGMAVFLGRLYYAVADVVPQVWSVGINLDGTFANDPRWELDVAGLASNNAVSDIVFDPQGRMILAQRGQQRGSYDYSVFAEPLKSSVVRYTREVPDNPATPGTWVPVAEQYAIGFPPDRHNANGGISLGYRYDANGYMRNGACGEFLWSTGESLRDDPALAAQLAAGGPATVDGLQGNDRSLVRPLNDPPFSSYFTDYDDDFTHPEHKGWMGDVEIYQPCQGGGYYIPPYYPPGYTPPGTGTFNLTLDKEATPKVCLPGGADWLCYYTVRITNTGTTWYWGPLSVRDWLPANPPGATMTFDFQPPWLCAALGPTDYQCDLASVLLFPGESVDLYVTAKLPQTTDLCYLDNAAQIVWWPGYGDQNPGDDVDFAQAQIPNPKCVPPQGPKTNLKIEKRALTDVCLLNAPNWNCIFDIVVTNTGPGVYNGPIAVSDTVPAPAVVADYAPKPNPPGWNCAPVPGAAIACDHAPVVLLPGQNVHLFIQVNVPIAAQADAGKCTVRNEVRITQAPGGSDQNTNAADDTASAEAKTPGRNCEPTGKRSDLELKKESRRCVPIQFGDGTSQICYFAITVKNLGPDSFAGPLTVHDVYVPAAGPAAFGAAWSCVGAPGAYDCTLNPAFLPMGPGAVRVLPMATLVPPRSGICKVDNTATISVPPGGSDANFNPANDSGSATGVIESEECRPVDPPRSNNTIAKTAGACTPSTAPTPGAAAAVVPSAVIDCAYTVKVSNTGPNTFNGPIVFLDTANVPSVTTATPSAAGWACGSNGQWAGCGNPAVNFPNGASASFTVHVKTSAAAARERGCQILNGAAIWGIPPVGPTNTIAADDVAFATAIVPALCQTVAPAIACPTDQKMPDGGCCPAGSKWNGRACSGSTPPPPPPPPPPPGKCPADSTGTPPNCTCKTGSHGVAGQCLPNVCPPGTVGNYPNCTTPPAKCQEGWSGTPPNCVPPSVQKCPSDSTGTYPRCVCKQGTHGSPGACLPNVCPPGTIGTYPNCTTPQACPSDSISVGGNNCRCRPGTHGDPGKCQPNVCPPGQVGNWPNCTTPQACPSDSHGTFPRCVCNAGTTGTPGKCVKIPTTTPGIILRNPGIIPILKCKSDETGTPPNCVKIPR
jgi:hypothetical protein